MTGLRLFAVGIILIAATIGWMILGGSIEFRTADSDTQGWEAVGGLWGEPQIQRAPTFKTGSTRLDIASSDITADFALDQRKKGLLWYATYTVDFSAAYGVDNVGDKPLDVTMALDFPSPGGVYDGFGVSMNGAEIPVSYDEGRATARFTIPPGSTARVETGYRTNGQDEWRYAPNEGVGVIEDFSLAMTTDFDEIDFPGDAVSPSDKTANGDGWTLTWNYESLVSGRPIGLVMPKPLNPGPVASRIAYFAPVSLLFYFAALVLLMAISKPTIHPMNFAFLAAGFFAFHLLFAYLVDRIDIYAAFAIATVVSVGLCVSYLRLAVRDRRTVIEAAIGQFVFLVLFSFSFFFEGFTGLAITIGAVLTLAYFMLRTARIDWSDTFARGAEEREQRRYATIATRAGAIASPSGPPSTPPQP